MIRDILRSVTVIVIAVLFYSYAIEEIQQKKRETIATVVMADKDPIKVVCAVDGTVLASRKMCIESAKRD
ncbi:hypothetical protein [Proteus phage vB_PmiM_ZX7]|nr:hypothetical protein [Proteus phage vB_PmiM_ZX7]